MGRFFTGLIALMVLGIASQVRAEPGETLQELLVRLDETASRYSEVALSFTCDEKIRWVDRKDRGQRKFGYVFTMDEEGLIEDYRTSARKRDASGIPKRVEPGDVGVPAYLRSAYLWVFIFKSNRWAHHHYELTGEGKIDGRPAVRVRFRPKPPYRVGFNNWFGTAWIDRESAQLLQVAAHRPEDEKQLANIERHAAGGAVTTWVYVVEQITTEFNVEERELRFPGRVELVHRSYDLSRSGDAWQKQARTILSVYQTYGDYRFFDVEAVPVDP